MANLKLKDNNWEASGVYDIGQQKNQRQINAEQADLKSALSDVVYDMTIATSSGASWHQYQIVSGHTYRIDNNGTSAILVKSVASYGSDTGIQTLASTTAPGDYAVTTATNDAPYLRVYSANAVNVQICDLSKRLPVLENKVKNIEDNEIALGDYELTQISFPNAGVYYGKDGTQKDASNYSSSNLITLPDTIHRFIRGKALVSGTNIAVVVCYDADGNYIEGYCGDETEGAHDYTFNDIAIPDNAKYARFSKRNGQSYYTELYSNISKDIDTLYNAVGRNNFARDYFVGYGNNDNITRFASIVDCLWAASQYMGMKRIRINAGTYDVLSELGGMEHIMEYSSDNGDTAYTEGAQPWIDNCEIIGEGRVILNFKIADNTPRANYWIFSCLNVRGNVTIENIEIHSKNCRYSIHDESGANYPNTYRKYKNVRCFQNENGGDGGQAVGCGFSENTIIDIEDCVFLCYGAPGLSAWSCHANNGCSIEMKNTIFDVIANDSNIGLRVSQNGNVYINCLIANCFINKGMQIRNETTPAPTVHGRTRISFINTEVNDFYCSYTDIDEPVISYNTISHTKTVINAVTV